MIVFSSFNDTNLLHSMLADCCMLKRREWGFMAAVGRRRPPWLIDARNHIEQKTSRHGDDGVVGRVVVCGWVLSSVQKKLFRRNTTTINLDITTYDEQEFLSFPIHMAACYTVLIGSDPPNYSALQKQEICSAREMGSKERSGASFFGLSDSCFFCSAREIIL